MHMFAHACRGARAAAGRAGFAPLLDFTVAGASARAVAAAQWDDPAFYASFLADADPHVGDWGCDPRGKRVIRYGGAGAPRFATGRDECR